MPRPCPVVSRCLIAAIVAAGAATSAEAQYFQWSGSVNNTWDTSTPNWLGLSNVWVNSSTSDAHFRGVTGEVTIMAPVVANHLFQIGGSPSLVAGPGGSIALEGSDPFISTESSLAISCPLQGSSGLRKAGPGTLSAEVHGWLYSGPTVISEGTLSVNRSQGVLPRNEDLEIAAGAVLTWHGDGGSEFVGGLSGGGEIRQPYLRSTRIVVRGSEAGSVFTGDIYGATIWKEGPGTQVFGGVITEWNTIFVRDGLVVVEHSQEAGPEIFAVESSTGTLGLRGNITFNVPEREVSRFAGAGSPSHRGVIDNLGGDNVFAGEIQPLPGTARIGASVGSLTLAGPIACGESVLELNPAADATIRVNNIQGQNLEKIGPGRLVLGGVAAIDEALTVEEGVVEIDASGVEMAGRVLLSSENASRLHLNGNLFRIGGLAGGGDTGRVDNAGSEGPATLQIHVAEGETHLFDGLIWNGEASAGVNVTKSGPGTQVFADIQLYGGITTVSEGRLISRSLGSSQILINGGTLQMNGNIGRTTMTAGVLLSSSGVASLTMSGGVLRPGGDGTAGIGMTGGLSATGGTIELHIRGPAPVTGHDRLWIGGGEVNIGEGVVSLALPEPEGAFTENDRVVILDNVGGGSTTGWFAGLPDSGGVGTLVPQLAGLGGQEAWRIYYHADAATGSVNGGNDIVLVPGAACAADFNGSSVVSTQDLFDFLAAYFAGDSGADFNHSGVLSVQDIFDFLAAFFAGCV